MSHRKFTPPSDAQMKLSIFCEMVGMIVMLLAFYNHHLVYFDNYGQVRV